MTPDQKAKITSFLNDRMMSATVYDVLRTNFEKIRGHDVEVLAATTLALQYLKDGFRDLEHYKNEVEAIPIDKKQIGL